MHFWTYNLHKISSIQNSENMHIKTLDEIVWNSGSFFFFPKGQVDDFYLFLVTWGIHFFAKNIKHPSSILSPFTIFSQNGATSSYCFLNSLLYVWVFLKNFCISYRFAKVWLWRDILCGLNFKWLCKCSKIYLFCKVADN